MMAKKARPPAYFTQVFPEADQVRGGFDRGAITEQKMIGFSGEGSLVHRIGPLYYWAWAQSHQQAAVEPHPHRGFEIMSYVLEGTIEHIDSLGNRSRIGAGGVQLMQTGSGVEHEEAFIDTPTESLQIWFDPHFRQQIEVAPTYHAYAADRFPVIDGAKIILGEESPIRIVTPDTFMQDLSLSKGTIGMGSLPDACGFAAIVIKGQGELRVGTQTFAVQSRDFIVHQGEHATHWTLNANEELRIIWIRVPLVLPYALFPKPR